MIQSALDQQGLQNRCPIVPFPLDRPAVWTNYIPEDATQFVRAFTEWERDKAQLLQSGGYAVRLLDGDPNKVVRATEIREALARGDEAGWRSLVPDGVAAAMPTWTVAK
jgi:nicotinamide mononucleotide adenylyltransferase